MSLGRRPAERRGDSNIFRREHHVEKNPAFRLAGRIFAGASEKQQYKRELRQSLQKSRPVGFGFGERHPYGPDESWESREDLRNTHDRDHYIVGENHGFDVDSL